MVFRIVKCPNQLLMAFGRTRELSLFIKRRQQTANKQRTVFLFPDPEARLAPSTEPTLQKLSGGRWPR